MSENTQEKMEAKARGVNIGASRKHCTEICSFIKGDNVDKAINKLEKVIDKELAVPYTKYNSDLAHKKGDMDAGRYPVNASKEVLKVVENAKNNAVYNGMSDENLFIAECFATMGNRYLTPKRNRGRKTKSAHVTIKLRER